MSSKNNTVNKQVSLVTTEISNQRSDNGVIREKNDTDSPKENLQEQHRQGEASSQAENTSPKTLREQPEQEEEKSNEPSNSSKFKSAFKKYWWLVPVLGVALAIGGVTLLRLQENAPEETATTQTASLSVRTSKAQIQPIRAWVSSEGRVRAAEYQHLTFEVEGEVTYLAERNGRKLREGDRVKKGELLARVDDRELLADLKQAQAGVDEAQQRRAAATADVAGAQAQVSQAQAQVRQARSQLQKAQAARNLAASNLDRYRFLENEGAVPAIEFDNRQNALEDAQADVQTARTQVELAQEQVRAAQAQVRAAQKQVEVAESAVTTAQARVTQAEVALEGASIYAPFDGIIAYLNYKQGDYFSPQIVTSQLAGDYQGILERIPMVIIDPSQYEVLVDLASPTGERVRSGQEAFIASETDNSANSSGDTYRETLIATAKARGKVLAVNPAISPGGRAIEARIRLNPKTTQDVRHGEQVLTWIAVAAEQNAVVVPLNAVVERDQTSYVFVVNQDKGIVEQRQVKLGITGITRQEIDSGVEAGELVVTEGQNRLVDGAPVQVVNRGSEG